ARGEWVMYNEKIPYSEYSKLPGGFYPSKFDAARWVAQIKASGARYITITSRHHDGFSMYATKASPYNIVDDTPFGRDVLKELADECHRQGITLNFYYSLLDWGRDDYPRDPAIAGTQTEKDMYARYLDFMCAQITELLTNYGPIGCIWFDGDWAKIKKPEPGQEINIDFDWGYERIYRLIHSLQPSCLVANNHHRIPIPGEDIQLFERDIPGENNAGYGRTSHVSTELALETCKTLNKSWGFDIKDTKWKSVPELIRILLSTAGRNANLLLNVGPQSDGCIPEESVWRLAAMGDWLKANGETIFGTRATMLKPQNWGVLTHKDNKIYLHVMEAPEGGVITLPFRLKAKKVTAFADGTPLKFNKKAKDSFSVTLPEAYDCSTDFIVEITL
ncbi:MAG: alpha-L-fucosidase, partial [Bacteroidales bacterium]|nr:alpha-L-fucosidase [Bacteroidales bacterium]